tara:strand:- start:669 stop:1253 length:585 start_codon:yes stop_codon:yes gene_type:complete
MTTILHVTASGRREDSQSRMLSQELVSRLQEKHNAEVVECDAADGLPFVNAAMASGYFTPEEKRTEAQKKAMEPSERLTDQLLAADILVLSTAMYNFMIPAALKAWFDLVVRTHRTVKYTEDGPVGLAGNKKTYLVVATGGTAIDSEDDYLTPYVKRILKFIGITDVTVIGAAKVFNDPQEAVNKAREQIKAAV